MTSKRIIAVLTMVACGAAASPALAQSSPYAGDDSAELFGYDIEVSETDSERVAENALRAVQRAGETAEEIKMVFGATKFQFVALKPDSMKVVEPELAKRQSDVLELQAAVESSALFYTAMRSEGVVASNVIGADLADGDSGLSSEKRVTIYLAP
ncbi:MAG: hypothetical protein ABS40_03115 [Agrobacterium sp. SCN 61-19]|nr:MAG: hypothetical protein ABS40_03115 [Agrobacterium sp. SCN 61-19]